MDEPLLLSIADASRLLNVSEKTISRMVSRGELPVVEIGRSRRIEMQALRHFIVRNRKYNGECVELVSSLTGENKRNSISERASTRSPSNWEDARLDALLKPAVKR